MLAASLVLLFRPWKVVAAIPAFVGMVLLHMSYFIAVKTGTFVFWGVATALVAGLAYMSPPGEPDGQRASNLYIGASAIAGCLLGIYYINFYSYTFGTFSTKAFSASVLGGLVDLRMSALGGLCLGIIENLGIAFTEATFRDVFAFGFLILMLVLRPQGFAVKKGTRV